MATKTKAWGTGTGSATIEYTGQGDGEIIITSDPNNLYEARSMQIVVETTDGSGIQRSLTVNQAAKQRINISNAVVTAAAQTYSGSAKTPTPIVTLNGTVIPSTGYDVAYSDNTNAGTATITVTGKGEYTGTSIGTFTINKASRTLSFADSYMVLNTSSTGTKTATPSAGSGDGAITYSIANTTYATINSSTGAVTAKTSDGSVIVTATIAAGTNYESASASYTLYVFATTHNYSYNGSYRSVTLPPGTYQFQVWGAQGASCSDGYSGGKGGYSVGQLSISQATDVRVYVGGQDGYNGGGSSTGSSSYNSGNTYGRSSMGNGGGASDIRLSDGALLSRMIVAGGGSGGAYCYKEVTTQTQQEVTDISGSSWTNYGYPWYKVLEDFRGVVGREYHLNVQETELEAIVIKTTKNAGEIDTGSDNSITFYSSTFTLQQGYPYINILLVMKSGSYPSSQSWSLSHTETSTSTDTYDAYQYGYAGGGTTGAGYSSTYQGKQNAAGSGGSFGQGANQTTTNYRFCSGAGGGGWYGGGGGKYSDNDMSTVHLSGGGSGFVNTVASAGNRPSGYTGLELDSGETYAGNTSFPAPGGGTETGHSGNGYIRITRL